MNRIVALVIAVVVVLLAAASTVFVVDPRHVAVVTAPGSGDPTLAGPGVHVKLPAPFQTETLIDTRMLAFSAADADRYTTSDDTALLVTPVVRYRVAEPLKLFAATKGDPLTQADRLTSLVHDALGDTFAKYTFADALAQQTTVAAAARDALKASAAPLGIDVVAVELTRIDYADDRADAVYKRMSAAREQVAANQRAAGAAAAQQIRDDANRHRDALLAQAYSEAQQIKGDGDGKAAAIAAQAYGQDPQFYRFWQSMQAYRDTFKPGDVVVVDSSSDFFRFMRGPDGGAPAAAAPAAPRRH